MVGHVEKGKNREKRGKKLLLINRVALSIIFRWEDRGAKERKAALTWQK